MINEIDGIRRSLTLAGISAGKTAREYLPLPNATVKNPCLRLYLRDDGSVNDIEACDPELVKRLKKYGNNQGTFPAFNIVPLYRIKGKADRLALDRLKIAHADQQPELLSALCREDNWDQKALKKNRLCLSERAGQLEEIIAQYGGGQPDAVLRLTKIARAYGQAEKLSFREALEKFAFDQLRRMEKVDLVLKLLFHVAGDQDKDSEKDRGSLSVFLDLAQWDQHPYPIASSEVTSQVNDALIRHEEARFGANGSVGTLDAFGSPYTRIDDPMPKVKLPGFDVSLRTMFAENPCQNRYGTIESSSYLLSYENRQSLSSALQWIGDGSREDVSWTRADKDELVFAYPSKIPSVLPGYIKILSPAAAEGMGRELFEQRARDFLKSFQGIPPKERPDQIQVFSLRKMDRARAKVTFSRNYDAYRYVEAAGEWQTACNNVPPVKTEEEIIVPFPMEVAGIVNSIWVQGGKGAGRGSASVKQMKHYDGIDLMLDTAEGGKAAHFLRLMAMNAGHLAIYAGREARTQKEREGTRRKSVQQVFPVLGMLLYKCGRRKEQYMEETAFLLGRILKVSDELHALYGEIERDDDVPRQLAGNSFYLMSSEMPCRALGQLGVRMTPYLNWAKRFRTLKEKKSGLVGWYLALYASLAEQLSGSLDMGTKFGEKEKAELFLGYLAALPKSEKSAERDDQQEDQLIDEQGVEEERKNG